MHSLLFRHRTVNVDVNMKRDLSSQLSPAALGHAELFAEVYTSPFHCRSELPVVDSST